MAAELTQILEKAVKQGASDIHLIVGRTPMMRAKGQLIPIPGYSEKLDAESSRNMIYSVLNSDQRAKFEEHWELDCSFALPGVCRFRLNVFVQQRGVSAAMRVIASRIPTPAELGLSDPMVKLADLPNGLVLVTGPTGSGKSTTIAALIQHINMTGTHHILTIEDPVEYMYEDIKSAVQQREVGEHTKSFSEALRHALRQDPDVIMVGEMRDLETIALAITAAETGHLCFATLHTNDAPSAIDRMIDVFPTNQQQQVRVQLSSVLQAVIAQQLIVKKDGSERLAARELMIVTPAISNLIREGKTHLIYTAVDTGGKYGMITMDKALIELVRTGHISSEEALSKARDVESMKNAVRGRFDAH